MKIKFVGAGLPCPNVIPAKAGIQNKKNQMDSRLRGNDNGYGKGKEEIRTWHLNSRN